jgi:hypothetical protein
MVVQAIPAHETASVLDIEQIVAELPTASRERFKRLFHVSSAVGEVMPPPQMHRWIERYFGSVDAVRSQKVAKITNRITAEGALFNELRAKRPLAARIPDELHEELARNAVNPFAEPLVGTPADTFGRSSGQYCITASNIAKYDGWHGVIVFEDPDPLAFDEAAVADYLDVAARWWRQAHAADPSAIYPLFMWNCLWKAGASIPHGHAQVSLTHGMHYAKIEHLRRSAESYRRDYGQSYFDDFYAAHRDLGLATELHGVRVMANLVPIKEKELLLLADRFDRDLARTIYQALNCLTDQFGVTSFNLVIYLPPLALEDDQADWRDFPILVRMVDRGDPMSRTADFGTMELYAASVVSSDPFKVARALFASFAAAGVG